MPAAQTSIDWGSSVTCSWRVMEVDPATWADSMEVSGARSGSVTRDATGRLLESGTVEVESDAPAAAERWARIEVLAVQGALMERHALATLLLVPSPSKVRRGGRVASYEGRSVLRPCEDRKMLAGSYAPKGADGAAWAARLLAGSTPAPVSADGSFELSDNIVFARKTSYLEAAWTVVEAAGWCIQVDGWGRVAVRKKPVQPALLLDRAGARLLGPEVESDDGLADVPNRFTAWDGSEQGQAVDERAGVPTSYKERGRYVDEVDDSPKRVGGESGQAYAERRLAELTEVAGTRSYERAWWPGVTVFDMVRGGLADADLVGDMRVRSQSLQLGAGISVTEEVEVLR